MSTRVLTILSLVLAFILITTGCNKEKAAGVSHTEIITAESRPPLSVEDLKKRQRWISQLTEDIFHGKDGVIWRPVAPGDTPSPLCELAARYNKLVATVTLVRTIFGPDLNITWKDLGLSPN